MVHWNFLKNLKKQAKQWKTDKKTGKQENVQKTGKNRKTGSVETLHLSLHYLYYFSGIPQILWKLIFPILMKMP